MRSGVRMPHLHADVRCCLVNHWQVCVASKVCRNLRTGRSRGEKRLFGPDVVHWAKVMTLARSAVSPPPRPIQTLRNWSFGYAAHISSKVVSRRASPNATSTTFRPCLARRCAIDLPIPAQQSPIPRNQAIGSGLDMPQKSAAISIRLLHRETCRRRCPDPGQRKLHARTRACAGHQSPISLVALLQVLRLVKERYDDVLDDVC